MPEPLTVTFGELLRQLRKNAGLTLESLAARAGVAVRTISDLELGKARSPHESTVSRLAWGLRLDDPVKTRFEAVARGRPVTDGHVAVGATVPPQILPRDIASFTGRTAELARLTGDAASNGRAAGTHAICGMPGVGKTTLAVHAAHLLRDRFPDRQLFIDLHAHTPGQDPVAPEAALAGLLAAAGVDARHLPADLAGRASLWRDKMADQRALLVLDNAASSEQVTPLLPGGDSCLVLVTSRRHLGDLPGAAAPLLLDALPPDQAQAMFERLARPAATGSTAAVAELVRLTGYLPLAISLLARVRARHPSWTMADLLRETNANLLTLAAEKDTVAAAFEVSYRYLPARLQQFFRRLGLHPGTTIDAYAAAALAGLPLRDAGGQLDALHGDGMLTEVGYRRYGMHDLVRRYARDLAAADPAADRDQALGNLLDFYLHTAAIAEARLARQTRPSAAAALTSPPAEVPDLPDRTRALAWVRTERANLLACLDHATRAGQHARVVAMTAATAALLRLDGPWAAAVTRHAVAVEAARHLGDLQGQANALDDLGVVLRLTGNYGGAARAQEEALRIYRDLGNRQGQANALNHLGTIRSLTDDYPQATGALETALGIYCDLGDRRGQADTLNHLGVVLRLTGDYRGAAKTQEEALAIFRDLGDRQGQANALNYLGAVRRRAGDYAGAAEAQEEALAIFRDLGNRQGQANALNYLGVVRQQTGDYGGAAEAQEEALSIFRDLGNRLGEANALGELGSVRRQTGDYPGATKAQEEVLGIYCDLGDRLGQASARYELGIVRRLTGNYPGAAESLKASLDICRQLGDRASAAEALNELGTLHRVCGDLDQATACHQRALHLAREIDSSWEEACAAAGLGRCALAAGRTADAEASLRQAWEIFQRTGAAEATGVAAELHALTDAGPTA